MQVVEDLASFIKPAYAVVTIGTFDGVHIGHQAILKQLIEDAQSNDGKSILITFWPHPRFILKKDSDSLKLLTTFDEKLALLDELGLDYVVKIPFTPAFSNLTAEEFVSQILVSQIGTKKLYIGHDHRFGNNREGGIEYLQSVAAQHDYSVQEIPKQTIADIGVSSTKIRNSLFDGEVQLANSLLGRSYSLSGTVIDGDKVGRKLGFPTANVHIPEEYKLLPGDGAYAIRALVDGEQHSGMLNIGFKPTVNGSQRTIEAHLFNFEKDIYGHPITIQFIRALRKEMKFESLEDLKNQLRVDKENAMNILS